VATLLFLIIGLSSLVGGFLWEGGHLTALLQKTAALIVLGGTTGAVGLAFPMSQFRRFIAVARVAFTERSHKLTDSIFFFIDIASLARKEGILALEKIINTEENLDHMTKAGLQLVADGVEHELIEDILETYIEKRSERHKEGIAMFESAGGFAPTMGIIGTVMGLVHVLGNLSDPGSLGPAISVAFIATLYGVGSANVIFLPMGNRLKMMNQVEMVQGQIVMQAILLIEKGVSPKIVEEKLKAFLDPTELSKFDSIGRPKEQA